MSNTQQERIAQWEKMVEEAPDSMAWFSLGNAYKDAERIDDAVDAYQKALALDESLSRAYQSLGQCLIGLERNEEAKEILRKGYMVAAEQGDVMPQKAMGSLLEEKLGEHPPETAEAPEPVDPSELGEDQIVDRRTGRPGTRMDGPPMRGDLGEFIAEHFSQETWREWIAMGTKVINEFHLDFSNAEHQDVYDSHMKEWLGVSDDDVSQWAQGRDEE
ncbi:MAG: Fe(2+)-trafficking protein [Phycisphaeraceae bacterium]|nr:Fe(2+)-trafficking protein [Phycisphaeraceae bacterium]